ncbi:MAG: thiamine pyrophosphate-dependent enzyme [bacterium]|nr:thiamine pyrophosphate-dependent enzyme [bacterium]
MSDASKVLLSGNEAVALGAFEAGVRVAAAYPGTPSTEILENLAAYPGVDCEWSSNEKVALDVAIGAAYAGRRALAVMKHVGLNVAADSLFYAAYTGLGGGGLVVAVADDPGMHSSQNEQDTRQYARFARVPLLEPADSAEARGYVEEAFRLGERFDTPVLLRLTTRIAHSRGPVRVEDPSPLGGRGRPAVRDPRPVPDPHHRSAREALAALANDPGKYVMIPGNARGRHPVVENRLARIAEWAETCSLNRVESGGGSLGVVSAGVAYQYAREVLDDASFLKLGVVWPLATGLLRAFAAGVDRLLVVEELDPFLEEALSLMGLKVEGKRYFPLAGELDPATVRRGAAQAGLLTSEGEPEAVPGLPPRPPVLCPGCGHRPVFYALRRLGAVVFGDIGCYTLGALPPLSALHTCGCMGAGLGNLQGALKALAGEEEGEMEGTRGRPVAVIGDSTFFHAGLPALANLAYNQGGGLVVILDNRTTAMTGHQDHPGTGRTLAGEPGPALDAASVARSLGVEQVTTLDPYDLEGFVAVARGYMTSGRPAVIVARHRCVLQARERRPAVTAVAEACNGCGVCLRLGCPPLVREGSVVRVEAALCTGCGVCAAVCPRSALLAEGAIPS